MTGGEGVGYTVGRMSNPSKILIVQPSWVGDAVMATPLLRAIRRLYPEAHIAYLMRRYVKPLYAGMPWMDQVITHRTGKTKSKTGKGMFDLAARLRAGGFDTAILLPNSFQSALLCKMARIPRVVGYERDGRSFLLTDRLLPIKQRGKFVPTPLVRYYMGLAHYLGHAQRDYSLQLFVTDAERREADAVLAGAGVATGLDRPGAGGGTPMVLLNPGANYGSAKLWPAEYFAELADGIVARTGATLLLAGAPKEQPILQAVKSRMKSSAVDLSAHGLDLGSLKEIVRRCDLMVTNDTGPRHIAAAMDTPVVTLFGPTDPRWTEIEFTRERQLSVDVFCGPCQKKKCPLDHRCMTRLTPAMALRASLELLAQRQAVGAG